MHLRTPLHTVEGSYLSPLDLHTRHTSPPQCLRPGPPSALSDNSPSGYFYVEDMIGLMSQWSLKAFIHSFIRMRVVVRSSYWCCGCPSWDAPSPRPSGLPVSWTQTVVVPCVSLRRRRSGQTTGDDTVWNSADDDHRSTTPTRRNSRKDWRSSRTPCPC